MAGRPTKFKPEYVRLVYHYCLLGATDAQLAQLFEVDQQTVDNWKHRYPEFRDALRAGKLKADAEVAESLFRLAKGYSHPDVHVTNYQGEVTVTPIVKHYPPNTTACIFWLKNRAKDYWRDRTESAIDLSASDSIAEKLRQARERMAAGYPEQHRSEKVINARPAAVSAPEPEPAPSEDRITWAAEEEHVLPSSPRARTSIPSMQDRPMSFLEFINRPRRNE